MNYEHIKTFIRKTLKGQSAIGKIFGIILSILIILSLGVYITENLDWKISSNLHSTFLLIDKIFLILFFIEYLARIIVAQKKLKYILSPFGLLDLIVILPLFFNIENLVFLRTFRLLEMLRLFKLVHYSHMLESFFTSFLKYKNELRFFFATFIIIMTTSALSIFAVEHKVNPAFNSIGDAFWWSIVTLSTLGYGDIVPITIGGRFLAGITLFLGLFTIAILTALITKAFVSYFFYEIDKDCTECLESLRHEKDALFCKKCGLKLAHKKENK